MTSSLTTEQEAITKRVCEVAQPDDIYLLATVEMKRRIISIFTDSAPSCHYTAHYLLLILESTAGKTHEVGERIESHCKPFIPVTAIVLKANEFAEWLTEKHPFALTVASRGAQLYGNGIIPSPIPLQKGALQEEARRIYNTNSKRTISFLAAADLFRLRVEYGMSAFMLHQATECLLRTAVQVGTGYYCNTHSLDKLFRLASFVLWQLPEIFGRYKSSGEALFSLLQRAYVEPRYKEGYKISGTDLETLFTKIEQLSQHLKEVIINNLVEV